MHTAKGKIYLVGAGPGNPDLLTLKASEIMRIAHVVVYDHLTTEAVMKLFPPEVERIYVGKVAGRHNISQDEIHKIMIEKARNGRIVVRLKGGDPFLFGRGGEEAQVLRRAGIEFEVVPGLTSALAVPAYAGIPVTHRAYASSVAIVTGHEDPSKTNTRVDWQRLATSVDTIVMLMGVGRLDQIVKELIRGGRKSETRVAIIEWGTTERQRTILGRLDNIAKRAVKERVEPPAVIVIGDVVELHDQLSWFRG